MSNKQKRAELRRLGQPTPERIRMVSRSRSSGPSTGVFDAIARRLANNECPHCGATIQDRVDLTSPSALMGRPKVTSMPVCVNGHRQDAWASQRPKETKS